LATRVEVTNSPGELLPLLPLKQKGGNLLAPALVFLWRQLAFYGGPAGTPRRGLRRRFLGGGSSRSGTPLVVHGAELVVGVLEFVLRLRVLGFCFPDVFLWKRECAPAVAYDYRSESRKDSRRQKTDQ
jgi:hypothetical protein